jgi:hypothetical protein
MVSGTKLACIPLILATSIFIIFVNDTTDRISIVSDIILSIWAYYGTIKLIPV